MSGHATAAAHPLFLQLTLPAPLLRQTARDPLLLTPYLLQCGLSEPLVCMPGLWFFLAWARNAQQSCINGAETADSFPSQRPELVQKSLTHETRFWHEPAQTVKTRMLDLSSKSFPSTLHYISCNCWGFPESHLVLYRELREGGVGWGRWFMHITTT